MAVLSGTNKQKKVNDPNPEYEKLAPLWRKCRAVIEGEDSVKEVDRLLDTVNFSNLLIPFSPSMSPLQYTFYKAEAELPGITSQFARMLEGGLLRKAPVLSFGVEVPEEITNWLQNEFGEDDSSLSSFLDKALWEELQTSRAWIFVDCPVNNSEEPTDVKPYPILRKAEDIINWQIVKSDTGKLYLKRVFVRTMEEVWEEDAFHPSFKETIWVHEINAEGYYQIRVFQEKDETDIKNNKVSGKILEEIDTITNIKLQGNPITFIPAWPLNGHIEPVQPVLTTFVNKEVALYNKLSRRNHLLYGASTYTPIVYSDMNDADFEKLVASGLGTWLKLEKDAKADVLRTPTEALIDMDRAITAGIEDLAKLGIRMLSPETAQSGIALELRNAAQTAQLGILNTKVCATLKQVISFMILWRYGVYVSPSEVNIVLSDDFNQTPFGIEWLTLATQWYESGLIPRSVWIRLLKQNELLENDYNDEVGQQEIMQTLQKTLQTQTYLAKVQGNLNEEETE